MVQIGSEPVFREGHRSVLSGLHSVLCRQGTCVAVEMLIQDGQNQEESHHSRCVEDPGPRG